MPWETISTILRSFSGRFADEFEIRLISLRMLSSVLSPVSMVEFEQQAASSR
jgi:hypothetical protein